MEIREFLGICGEMIIGIRGVRIPGNHSLQSQLIKALRCSLIWKQQPQSPYIHDIVVKLGVCVVLLTVGMGLSKTLLPVCGTIFLLVDYYILSCY